MYADDNASVLLESLLCLSRHDSSHISTWYLHILIYSEMFAQLLHSIWYDILYNTETVKSFGAQLYCDISSAILNHLQLGCTCSFTSCTQICHVKFKWKFNFLKGSGIYIYIYIHTHTYIYISLMRIIYIIFFRGKY